MNRVGDALPLLLARWGGTPMGMKPLILLWVVVATPLLADSTAASIADAYVREVVPGNAVKGVWELGNSEIELRISYESNRLLLTRLFNPRTGTDWTPPHERASIAQVVDLRFLQTEYRIEVPNESGTFPLRTSHIGSDEKSVWLELVFTRNGPQPMLELHLYYRSYPGSFVETWAEVRNLNAPDAPRIEVLRVGRTVLPIGAVGENWKVASSQSISERPDLESDHYGQPLQVDWLDLPPGRHRKLPLHASTYIQTIFLKRNSEESLIAGVYFGHRRPMGFGLPGPVAFERSRDGAAITAEFLDLSEAQQDKREVLWVAPNQYARGLTHVFGFAGGGLDSASRAYHDLARRYLSPPPPAGSESGFPWVENNAYFAYDLGFSARALKRDVDIAAELGAEVFILDAGWWEGAIAKCEIVTEFADYLVFSADYTPDHTSRFPASEITFKEFSQYVRAKGMRFGLWLCPFNIDAAHNTGWEPSWLNEDGTGLCAAHKPAYDWVKGKISDLVTEYEVDFLKFDCGTARRCTNTEHETTRRVGSKEYVIPAHQGYANLLRDLQRDHPTVALEDGPMLGHVSASSDDWDLSPRRGRAEQQKARFHLTPQYTAHYMMLEPARLKGMSEEHHLGYMAYVIRSNMLGHIILSSELSAWRPRFRAIVKRHIQIYRTHRRALTGEVYELAFDSDWEALQFQEIGADSSVVFAFRNEGENPKRRFVLRGLEPEKTYRVSFEDHKQVLSLTGNQLMTQGLPFALPFALSSEIAYVQRTDLPAARPGGGLEFRVRGKAGLKIHHAPFLEGADASGHYVVFRDGSDFDPDTYDLGFDGNLGTVHVPVDRQARVCPDCVPRQTDCKPGVWNCQQCPHLIGTPGHPDSDLDSLPNWWEEAHGRQKPLLDPDGDGLNNLAEYRHMTNPLSTDTDADGWSDALEIGSFETDPLRNETGIRVLYVNPESRCSNDCGTRHKPHPNLQDALESIEPVTKTLVLVASGTLNGPVSVTQLPDDSFLGLFGGFDSATWTRQGGETIVRFNDGPALRLAWGSSMPERIVVQGFTIVGGILIEGSSRTAVRVELSRNRIVDSSNRAAIEIQDNSAGQVRVINNLIARNREGILSTPTWLLVLNCTIVDNAGYGIRSIGDPEALSSTSINNIVWNNKRDVRGVGTLFATLCQGDSRCISADPGLEPGYRLPTDASRSPALDAGISSLAGVELLFDIDGRPRVVGAAIDLGVREQHP